MDIEEAAEIGFGEGAPKLARRELCRDVEERSGDRSHRKPAAINDSHLAGVMNTNFGQ
jgi:hypothetical protein